MLSKKEDSPSKQSKGKNIDIQNVNDKQPKEASSKETSNSDDDIPPSSSGQDIIEEVSEHSEEDKSPSKTKTKTVIM